MTHESPQQPLADQVPAGRSAGDYAATAIQVGVSSVPLVGGGLAAAIEAAFTPPLQRRRNEFLRVLAEAIDEIRARAPQLDLATLTADDAWVSAVVEADRIALGEHLEEKLQMLKACLVNMSLPTEGVSDLRACPRVC